MGRVVGSTEMCVQKAQTGSNRQFWKVKRARWLFHTRRLYNGRQHIRTHRKCQALRNIQSAPVRQAKARQVKPAFRKRV